MDHGDVSGVVTIDWENYEVHSMVLVGDITLEEENTPGEGISKTITMDVSGAHGITLPISWGTPVGLYDDAIRNKFIVQHVKEGQCSVEINKGEG